MLRVFYGKRRTHFAAFHAAQSVRIDIVAIFFSDEFKLLCYGRLGRTSISLENR